MGATQGQIEIPEFIWTTLPNPGSVGSEGVDWPQVDASLPRTSDNPAPCWIDVGSGTMPSSAGVVALGQGVHDPLPPELRQDAAGSAGVDATVPLRTVIGDPFPNPTNGATRLRLDVAAGSRGRFRADVFDVAGRRVTTLMDRVVEPGSYLLEWPGVRAGGGPARPGVYFLRVVGPEIARNAKIVVLR